MATSTPQLVEQIVRRSPFLIDAMADHLINLSALARRMQPEIEKTLNKKASQASIMMALKRLAPQLKKHNRDVYDFNTGDLDMTVRSELTLLVYKNSSTLIAIEKHGDASIQWIKGATETTCVTKSSLTAELEQQAAQEILSRKKENIAALSIRFPHDKKDTLGGYSTVIQMLTWEHIVIHEMTTVNDEFILLLDEDAVDRAVHLLKGRQ
jgi:hypothetical protein